MTRRELFVRCGANPILRAEDWPYPANAVFNAGAAVVDGETLLLVRVEDLEGFSHFTAARSRDGRSGWRIDPEPCFRPDPGAPWEAWGVEDPRITWLTELERFAVTYTAYSADGPLVAIALTRDFKTFERLGPLLPPENKDAAVLPTRFGGAWLVLHRPVPAMGGTAHIWLSRSPDLRHVGEHRVLLRAASHPRWDAGKIGLSAPPLRTEAGWLLLYHGVKQTAAGALYRQGLALLDLDDPSRVRWRRPSFVFAPYADEERSGDVRNVVFSCGWTCVEGEVRMYYGAGDSSLCMASAPLEALVAPP